MATTARLGFDITATDKTGAAFNSAKKLLDQVNATQKAVASFAAPVRLAENATARFGSRIQNASFQVSDFAVQVGSGTDATRALAQQLPQLLGGLGTFGAVAGAAAAIVLPLAMSLGKTRDYAKELKDGLEGLDGAQKVLKTSIVDLTEEYGKFASLVRDVAKVREGIASSEIAKSLVDEAKAVEDVNAAYTGTVGAIEQAINQWKNADFSKSVVGQIIQPMDDASKAVTNLQDKFGLSGKAAQAAAEPMRQFTNAVEHLNTDAAALAIKDMNRVLEHNRDIVGELGPLYAFMNEKWSALAKIKPPAVGSMGMSLTPITPANTFVNTLGDMKVAQQLLDIEKQITDAKNAAAAASRLAAQAQRQETAEYERFISTLDRGTTPLDRIQNIKQQAQQNFAKFGDQLNMDQIAQYGNYISDLNKQIDDLTFRKKWDEMAEGMQVVTDAMTPFKNMVDDIGQGIQDSFVNNLSGAFSSFIDGTQSAKQALESFAQSFLKEVSAMIVKALALYAVQKLLGFVSESTPVGLLRQQYGGVYANGGVFSGGRQLTAFASGGIVNGPTLFPMAGGAGLMGEAGPEAIVPLTRQNGKLGVGASPVAVTVNNYAGAEVRTSRDANDRLQIDIIKKVVSHDFARGGEISQSLERGYGMRRAGR